VRRAAAPLLLGRRRRSISSAGTELSSKPRCGPVLLLGAQRRPAINRYLLPAGRLAANPQHAAAAVDKWTKLTDRRTDTRPLRKPCSEYDVGSANNCDMFNKVSTS